MKIGRFTLYIFFVVTSLSSRPNKGKYKNTYKARGSRSRRLLLTSMAAIGLLLGGVGLASATTSPSPSPIPTQAPVVTSLVPAPAVTEAPETKGDHCWNDKADDNDTNDESDVNEANDESDTNDESDVNEAKCDAVAPSTTIG